MPISRLSRLRATLSLFVTLATVVLGPAAASDGGTGGLNAPGQLDKPYVVLISIDGLGPAAFRRSETPVLDRLAREGSGPLPLVPVFPTLTFPNHYSIATGLPPADHGIVGNRFPDARRERWYALYDRDAVQDGRWYRGEPIWVRAEKSGLVAAAYFFVGTEAAVSGVRPSYYYLYEQETPGNVRVAQVLDWLRLPAERRPHFITLYFEDVDTAGHVHGPHAPQTLAAVERVDSYIGQLVDGMAALPVANRINIVVVSDHGLAAYDPSVPPLVLADHVDLSGMRVVAGGSYAMLYLDEADLSRAREIADTINAAWKGGRAYARPDAPAAWRVADDGRYPDVIVQPDIGRAVVTSKEATGAIDAGDHGWPPEAPEMYGIYVANGPQIPAETEVGEKSVLDVYPMLIDILGLANPDNNAGKADVE